MLGFSWFVCGVLYALFYSYLFCSLVCREKFKIDQKNLVGSVIFSIVYFLIMYLDTGAIRPYITHISIFLVLQFIYRKPIVKTIIGIFCNVLIILLSEIAYDIFIMSILKTTAVEFIQTSLGFLCSNICIFLIAALLSKTKFIKKLCYGIISWYNKNEFMSTIIFVAFALTIIMFFAYNNHLKFLPTSMLWFTNLFCIGVMIFVIGFFRERSNNNRIVSEYDQLLDYVKKYEKVIDEKSKNQHEYKNQLILIKGMINKTNKKAIQYIDSLYNNEKEDENLELLQKLQYLPNGGLKGLIYYKVEEMINKKIDVYVDISSELSKVRSKKQLNNNLHDISKVLGVYIDNAIEATMSSKQKYIIIESYLEKGYIVFSISNTYSGNVALDKVDKEGYTTKGEGKGYGLSLVKDIISKSDYLKQERSLNGMYYVQKLYIKK